METYTLNTTNPVGSLTENWALTAGSSHAVASYFPATAYVVMDLRRFLDAASGGGVLPGPRSDAGVLADLYSFEAVPDLDALAEAQGVRPIEDIDDLVADFWSEDESVEEFIATVRRWRDEEDSQPN